MTAGLCLRGALGAAAYLSPGRTGRALGVDPVANPASPYLARVFGVRDVALAVLTATASGPARRRLVLACAAIDTADTASALLSGRAGHLDRRATAGLVAVAVAALVPELLELRG